MITVLVTREALMHYASQYYDPAKAHEYYLKTRELKGRTTNGMSDAQKEAWGYAKEEITKEKNSKMEELRTKAKEARDQIAEKLAQYADKNLKQQASKAERERIVKELKDAIESVRAEYEKIYDKEYDNIKANIKGKEPKKPKPKKPKKKAEGEVDWETFDKT